MVESTASERGIRAREGVEKLWLWPLYRDAGLELWAVQSGGDVFFGLLCVAMENHVDCFGCFDYWAALPAMDEAAV